MVRRVVLVMAVVLLAACGPDDEATAPVEEVDPTPTDPVPDDDDEAAVPAPGPAAAWTTLAEAPLALSEVAVAPLGGQVWTAGGFTAEGEATARVQVLDPTFESWSDGPDLPEAVHHAALVATGQALYLVGGYAGSGFDAPTAAVHRLDLAVGSWVTGPPLPAPRAAGAAAWDGERIVYGGGVGPDGLAGEVFVLDGDEWVGIGALSQPREHLAAAGDGQGRTWFLGGRTAGLDTNLGTVDLVEGASITTVGALPTPRGGVAGFWSAGTGACVLGGEDPDRTYGEVECIDAEGAVRALPSLEAPRHGLGAVVVDGIAYAALGGPEPGLTVSPVVEALRLDGLE
ncbi:MAG: hypothetical protein WD080_04150 [Egibacteraceae bacterium]